MTSPHVLHSTSTGGQRTSTRPATMPNTSAASRSRSSGATSAIAPTTRATTSSSSRLNPSSVSPMQRMFAVPVQLSLPRCRRGGARPTPSDHQLLRDLRAARHPPSPSLLCRTHHLSWSRASRLVAAYTRERDDLPQLPLSW